MKYNQDKHWRLYTSKGYLWMSGKCSVEQVNQALNEVGAELYEAKYMGDDNYITYLKVKFDKIYKMPCAER